MKLGKLATCIGVGALCVVTGGLAAPAIGAAIGTSFMGLSGVAATSAGLAALGGGSLAAGGLGMAGGTALVQAIAGGLGVIGAGIATNASEGAKSKRQNKELREELRKANLDNSSKQHIIKILNSQIQTVKQEMEAEQAKAQRNEEKIRYMQEQLDDIYNTLGLVQNK